MSVSYSVLAETHVISGSLRYIQSGKLDVGVLIPYPLLQCAHGISRLHCLGANNIGYLEVEGHVLSSIYISMYIEAVRILEKLIQARRCRALDLLVERAGGRGPEPARHDVEALPAGG